MLTFCLQQTAAVFQCGLSRGLRWERANAHIAGDSRWAGRGRLRTSALEIGGRLSDGQQRTGIRVRLANQVGGCPF